MNDVDYPHGEIGKLLLNFLETRCQDLGVESDSMKEIEWEDAWEVAFWLRDLLFSFYTNEKANNPSDGERNLDRLTKWLHCSDSPVGFINFCTIALEHAVAESLFAGSFQSMKDQVRWVATRIAGRRLSRKKKSFHYLQRVVRTYLLGLEDVCLIMCRAAVEGWFEENVSGDLCQQELGYTSERWSLEKRIEVARQVNMISADGENAANRIREFGNRAVHGKFVPPPNLVEQTIDDLISLFSELDPETAA